MGIALKVHHLAVISSGYFASLQTAQNGLLQHWDSAQDPLSHFHVRNFVRQGKAVECQLPIEKLESFNQVGEQLLFAQAAIRAGVGGYNMIQDLTLFQQGLGARIKPARLERLTDMMSQLAMLPKTRIRLPGGVQHLLADPIDQLLVQTPAMNDRFLRVRLLGYVPEGVALDHPNARLLGLDQADILAHHSPVAAFMQRAHIHRLSEPTAALAFNQLNGAGHIPGQPIWGDFSGADSTVRTHITVSHGAAYLVTNHSAAISRAVDQPERKSSARLILPQRNVLN